MKIHHLDCGTMDSPGAPMVCHVLVVETDAGLVLVDTGYGLFDCADPARRLGAFRHVLRPVLRVEQTAVRQIEALGYARDDVRHIVTTHFDLDHIGGLADFPEATVHVTSAEIDGAVRAPSRSERRRFRAAQWAHDPHLVEYAPRGESWRGFDAVRELDGVAPGIALIFLPGHTRGHAGVAVDAGDRWILHCGDAFYTRGTLDGHTPIPTLLTWSERLVAFDRTRLRANQERLAELWRRAEPDLFIVSAHDAELLAQARTLAGAGAAAPPVGGERPDAGSPQPGAASR